MSSWSLYKDITIGLASSALVSLVPGAVLSAYSADLMRVPGLLTLIPALIGMRGNVFGSVAAKLSTTVQEMTPDEAATLERTPARAGGDAVARDLGARYSMALGEMLALSGVLPLVLLAACVGAGVLGEGRRPPLVDLLVVCALSGVSSAYVMMYAARQLVYRSYERGANPDNVAAPFVTTLGDLITIPLVLLAAAANAALPGPAWRVAVLAAAAAWMALKYAGAARLIGARGCAALVAERLPVLVACMSISFLAGLALENMMEEMEREAGEGSAAAAVNAFLVALSPMFNAQGGSGGGIFASRVSTFVARAVAKGGAKKDPLPAVPPPAVLGEAVSLAAAVCTVMAALGAFMWQGVGMPAARALAISGGMAATLSLSSVVSYYTARACHRLGLDPDNFGVPVTCATMDLLASLSFMVLAAL